MFLLADTWAVALATAAIGAGLGALVTGLFSLFSSREAGTNKWLEFKRGNARGYLQHIAVHKRPGEVSQEDERLIGHYYTLALAVSADDAARALYEGMPDELRERIHDPGEQPLSSLRHEVTPGRRAAAPPGDIGA